MLSLKAILRKAHLFFQPSWREISIDGESFEFQQPSYSEYMELNRTRHEYPILRDLLSRLHEDDVFWDVGANLGLYTVFAGEITDTICSFEPVPRVRMLLHKNCDHNDVSANIYTVALGDADKEIEMDVPDVHGAAQIKEGGSLRARMVRGDLFRQRESIPSPDVVKIDVEGAELKVLNGLEETLKESCRLLYCEAHEDLKRGNGVSNNQVKNCIESYGFETKLIQNRKDRHFVYRGVSIDDCGD